MAYAREGVGSHPSPLPPLDNCRKINSYLILKQIDFSSASAAWRSGLERRFYDDHDRKINGSTPNLGSLLRPWIRCFTIIISAWWILASSKLKK